MGGITMIPEYFDNLLAICSDIVQQEKHKLPLCAAENVMSPFCKLPLDSFIQEKYIMGGILEYQKENNFVGSSKLYNIYTLLNKQCSKLFKCHYADARTLSGVNAVTTLLMSLFEENDTILISSENCGGHGSMPKICHRLGINTLELPYNYTEFDFNYTKCNELLGKNNIAGILICISDIIKIPQLHKINLPDNCILIFDATQILGLIASNTVENPINWFRENQNFILMGATHKTLPGPTCGLIMTNNMDLARRFDQKINPDYLRNNQLHHILSLILALMELEVFGKEYCEKIVNNANYLGKKLAESNFNVLEADSQYTYTHQLFISMAYDAAHLFFERCQNYGVSLNLRDKTLYRTSGIRLGLQEISRYNWSDRELKIIAQTLKDIRDNNVENISKYIDALCISKELHFTFDHSISEKMKSVIT